MDAYEWHWQQHRTEQALLNLRIRNGELAEALRKHAPEVMNHQGTGTLDRLDNFPSRYNIIDGLIERAARFIEEWNKTDDWDLVKPEVAEAAQELAEAINKNKNYWSHVAQERQRRADKAEHARNNKTKDNA